MDLDSTRPVTFSGEQDSRLGAVDWHYPVSTVGTGTPPDGYNESFYPFALMVHPERPFATTEDVGAWAVGVPCAWWQGFFLRGMRCNDWADIRPIGLSIWLMSPKKPYMGKVKPEWGTKAANLKASAAPVGLYDKEYDDIPTAVKALRDRVYPEIKEGEIQKRLLVLFNDEMSGAEVAATVEAFLDGEPTPFAQGTRTYRLTPGDHLTIPCRFQAPYVEANRTMKLVLRTSKGGVARFSEDRLFTVKDAGRSGTPSDKVEPRAPVAPILLYDFDEGLSPKFSRMAAASAVTAVGGALGPTLYPSCVANKGTLDFSPGSGRSFAWSFNATGMSNLLVRFYLAAYGGDAKAEAPKIVGMDVGQDPTKVAPEPAKPYVLPSVQVTVDGVAHEVTGAWAGGTWRGAGQRYGLHATKCVELDLSDLADGRRSVRVSMSLPEIPAQGHIYLEDLQVLGTCAGVAGAVPPPASVAARAVGPLAIDVEWKPPVSTAKLTCNVYRDGRRLNNLQVEGASFRDFGLQPTTQYKYTVTAEDPAGNESAAVSTTATTGPMRSEIAVNFQPASMPPVTGCEVDSGAPYDERRPGLRHGWLRPERRAACSPVERNVNPDKLLDSCVGMDKGLEWEIDVANGVYEVTASVGDAGADTTNWLNVEGQPFLAGVALKRDKFAQTTRRLLVRDGKLTLDNDCQATMTALNYLRVRYVSPPVAPPVADAGPDRNVPAAAGEAAAVKLDASGSQVAGKIVDCVWTGVGRNVLSKSKTDTIRVQRRGIQTIRLTVTDDLGLTACDCFNLNVFDSDSPAAPQGLKATALAPTEIKVEWSPSASAPAIETKYVLYRDNKLIATVCGTGYRDGGLQPGTAYSYTVKAVDAAERTSPASEPRRATTPTGQDPGLLAYEGFTQPAGILHGGNQGFGWAGPWSIECSQYSFLRIATMQVRPVLDEPILSGPAASLARTGSHVWCWQPASGYRPLDVDGAFADYRVSSTDRNLGKSGTVLWFSCLARMDAPEPTASLKPCNLGFRRRAGDKWEGTDAFSIGGFGFDKEKKATWKIEAGPPGQPLSKTDTGIPCMLNRVHLVVVRMTFGTPSRIDLYIDPPVGGVPPDKPDATAQVPNADGSFKFAWFTFRSAVDPGWPAARYGHRLDELRLGRSFAAVTPEDAKRGTP